MKNLIPLTLLVVSAPAWCQPCSNADLRGVYLLQTSGHVNLKDLGPGLPDLMAPMAAFGLVEYDGNGSVSGRLSGTWGGMAASFETVEAKYSINRDCTATAEFKFKHVDTAQLVGPDRHRCVVLEDGDLVRCLLVESPGRTLINSTEMRRMNRGRRVCDASVVRGSYGVHYNAWVNMQALNPSGPAYFAPAVGVGAGRFDPGGASTGAATHIFGGVRVETETVSASVKVNPDCTGLMEHTVLNKTMGGTTTSKSPIVVLDNGEHLIALYVEVPGFVYYSRIGMQ